MRISRLFLCRNSLQNAMNSLRSRNKRKNVLHYFDNKICLKPRQGDSLQFLSRQSSLMVSVSFFTTLNWLKNSFAITLSNV